MKSEVQIAAEKDSLRKYQQSININAIDFYNISKDLVSNQKDIIPDNIYPIYRQTLYFAQTSVQIFFPQWPAISEKHIMVSFYQPFQVNSKENCYNTVSAY